ncbi:hypothetical protein B0I35DRAFT_445180 [Stachybotrys elegans]|uniref:Uncharacterized protein n=1 Tax=Stachybotrys elegans TaxID=80388 RepID=A0A8K0SA11_9HYPO|nr:hypothetical protein B0I35DRAFT_445180 [Stachybotrys elegans]
MKYLIKVLGFALLFTTAAQAVTNYNNAPSGAHYASGFEEPACALTVGADGVSTVKCTGTQIGGVGHTNANVLLAVTATFTGVCQNPGVNRKIVEPFTETKTDTVEQTIRSTKNGQLVVPEQTTIAETTEDFEATFECPNPNWMPEVTSSAVTFVYTLTFEGFTQQQPFIIISGP